MICEGEYLLKAFSSNLTALAEKYKEELRKPLRIMEPESIEERNDYIAMIRREHRMNKVIKTRGRFVIETSKFVMNLKFSFYLLFFLLFVISAALLNLNLNHSGMHTRLLERSHLINLLTKGRFRFIRNSVRIKAMLFDEIEEAGMKLTIKNTGRDRRQIISFFSELVGNFSVFKGSSYWPEINNAMFGSLCSNKLKPKCKFRFKSPIQ